VRRCLRDPTFSRFDTILKCDRHTTTAYTALSIASRSINGWDKSRDDGISSSFGWELYIVILLHFLLLLEFAILIIIRPIHHNNFSIVLYRESVQHSDTDEAVPSVRLSVKRWYCVKMIESVRQRPPGPSLSCQLT